MAGTSSVSNVLSELHDPEITDLKTLFAQGFNIETADHDLINKFVVYRFNQYAALNAEDYRLWNCIHMDFEKFEAKHFDNIDSRTWTIARDYCYSHGYWIDHNFGPGRTRTTTMMKAVNEEWNNKWSLEQINWVEERYNGLSKTTRKRKQELTGIPDLASNLVPNTANSRGISIEPQSQSQFQDIRFQTTPQQAQQLSTQLPAPQIPQL